MINSEVMILKLVIKNYFIGTNVFTNTPKNELGFNKNDSYYVSKDPSANSSELFNNKNGTYNIGQKYSSPLYFWCEARQSSNSY